MNTNLKLTQQPPAYFGVILQLKKEDLSLILPIVLLVGYTRCYPPAFEDAFITYRYAQNLAEGNGLVFNPGQIVEGYTSFLWVVLLCLFALFITDLQTVAPLLSLSCGIALIIATYAYSLACRPNSRWSAVLACILVALHSTVAMYSVTGMESILFTLLLILALTAVERSRSATAKLGRPSDQKPIEKSFSLNTMLNNLFGLSMSSYGLTNSSCYLPTSRTDRGSLTSRLTFFTAAAFRNLSKFILLESALGILLVLASLCRPEGVLYSVLVLILFGIRHGFFRAFRIGQLYTLLYGSYFLWRYAHFGTLFPNTYYAKVVYSSAHIGFGVGYVEGFMLYHFGILGLIGATVALFRKEPWSITVLVVMIANGVSTAFLGGDIFPLFRFLLISIPLVCICTIYLFYVVGEAVYPRYNHSIAASVTVILCFLLLQAPHVQRTALLGNTPVPPDDWRKIQRNYRVFINYERIAQWMKREVPDDWTLAINAAGVIPYRTGLRTIDMLGLNDVHIAHKAVPQHGFHLGHEKHDAHYVLNQKPDIIFIGLPLVARGPPSLQRLNLIWSRTSVPGDIELLKLNKFHSLYRPVVMPIDSKGYTAFFARKDKLSVWEGSI